MIKSIDSNKLVRSIRVSRAFLDEKNTAQLCQLERHPDPYVIKHALFFTILKEDVKKRYQEIHDDGLIKGKSFTEWLYYCALWVESHRIFEVLGEADLGSMQYEWNTVSLFLDYYIHITGIQNISFSDKNLLSVSESILRKEYKPQQSGQMSPELFLLEKCLNWYKYIGGVVDVYCYDRSYDVKLESDCFVLCCNSIPFFRNWVLTGKKLASFTYVFNPKSYNEKEMLFLFGSDTNIENEVIERYAGKEIVRRHLQNARLLEYYALREVANFPLNANYEFWNQYSAEALTQLSFPLDAQYRKRTLNWLKCIKDVQLWNKLLLVKKDNLLDFNQSIENQFKNKSVSEFIIKQLVYDIQEINKTCYSPIRSRIDILQKPFLKIENTVLSFPLSVANEAIGIALITNLLTLLEKDRYTQARITQTKEMEKSLGVKFKNAGFTNFIINAKYKMSQDKVKAEFDLMVYEDGVLLLIELKRTKLRVSLDESYFERQGTLAKAARQLKKGQEIIKNDKQWLEEILDTSIPGNLQIIPLIVSTSFEHDHELIDNVAIKVSLHEVQNILEIIDFPAIRQRGQHPLLAFRQIIEENAMWQEIELDLSFERVIPPSYEFSIA